MFAGCVSRCGDATTQRDTDAYTIEYTLSLNRTGIRARTRTTDETGYSRQADELASRMRGPGTRWRRSPSPTRAGSCSSARVSSSTRSAWMISAWAQTHGARVRRRPRRQRSERRVAFRTQYRASAPVFREDRAHTQHRRHKHCETSGEAQGGGARGPASARRRRCGRSGRTPRVASHPRCAGLPPPAPLAARHAKAPAPRRTRLARQRRRPWAARVATAKSVVAARRHRSCASRNRRQLRTERG